MDLILGRNVWLLLALLVLAATFAWWAYSRMTPVVPPPRRAVLVGLRFGVLGIVLFLLFEPILQRILQRDEVPVVAVLLDDSRGLSEVEGRTGEAGVRQFLASQRDLDADVVFYRFAGDVERLDDPDPSLTFEGARTDIALALSFVADDLADRNLRSVVLVSDGRFNTGRNPLYLADRYPVAIHTVTVGDTTQPRDVWMGDIVTNDLAYTGLELPVRAHVHADGFAGQQATVMLSLRGAVLDQQSVTLPAAGERLSVDLSTTPEEEGINRYAVSVTRLDGEATHANNVAHATVRVASRQRTALLLSGAPGPDLSALRATLLRDDDVEVIARTPRGDGGYYEGALGPALESADLLILVGFPGARTPPSDIEAVARAAETLPVLFVLTRQTEIPRISTDLASTLPVRPDAIRSAFLDVQLAASSAARGHAVTNVPGVPLDQVGTLPPVQSNETRWAVDPDTRVLFTPVIRGIQLDDPLISVRQRGRQRSAAILAASTWRWSNLPSDLEHLDGFYHGLIENLTRWLTADADDRPLRVRATQDFFDTTERVRFTAQAYDERLEPVADAEIQVILTSDDGSELPFAMRPLGSGRYDLDAGMLPEGVYRFRASAERQGAAIGEDQGTFEVGVLDLEMRHVTADPALMAELAARTGGTAAFPDQADRIAASIAPQLERRSVTSTSGRELWRLAPLALLLIGMLTTEWVLRKRSGMV